MDTFKHIVSGLFGALVLVAGIYYLVGSFSVELFTGVQAVLVAVACFIFVGLILLLGVQEKLTQNNRLVAEQNQHLIELIRRTGQPQTHVQGYSPPVYQSQSSFDPREGQTGNPNS